MSKIEELLMLSEQHPESFDDYIYSIADTINDVKEVLVSKPFIRETRLIAGYQVSYGYRIATEKIKDGGDAHHVEVYVYNIFTFLNKAVTENKKILEEVNSKIIENIRGEIAN